MNGPSDDLQQILTIADLAVKRQVLADHINRLIESDFNRLVQALYRLDIDEHKLRRLLSAEPRTDAGILIADMILERQAQKQKSRELFSRRDDIMNDEEKW